MINEYDEMKLMLKRVRVLLEQPEAVNLGKSIENNIEDDEKEDKTQDIDVNKVKKDKNKTYRISGGLLTLHGKEKRDLELTTDEKTAFQETMDEFVSEVSDLVDFNKLNLYESNVEWSGKIQNLDIEFFFSIGETNGMYINGDMIQINDEFVEFITKLRTYYEKFKAKWAKVIANRKKTK